MAGFIRLADHEWPVRKATFGATILPLDQADFHWGPGTGGVSWSLSIKAEYSTIDGHRLAPSVSVDSFVVPLRTWHDMEGREFDWSSPADGDDSSDRDRPIICLYDHDDILGCKAHFGHRTGNVFDFELVGECAFFSGADRLRVEAPLTFVGVGVRAPSPPAAWRCLCEHLDGKGFSPAPVFPGESWVAAPSYIGFGPSVT